MKESIFQYELKKTIEEEGGWAEKFPDMPKTGDTRFIPKKPADLIAVVNKKPVLIECKIIKEVKNIRPNFFGNTKEKKEKVHWTQYHQVKELIRFYHQGCDSYYAINLRTPRKINQLILLHIEQFLSMFLTKEIITKDELLKLADFGIKGAKKRFPGLTKKLK